MMDDSKINEIITKTYQNYLDRIPDKEGFNQFYQLIKKNQLDEKDLIKKIKNSQEYKGRMNLTNMSDPWSLKKIDSIKRKFQLLSGPFCLLPKFLTKVEIYV